MDELSIKKYFSPGVSDVIIVKLTGYVDHSNSRQVEKVISEILEIGKIKIIFDFSELVYMSSAGWGVFVGEIKTVREKGGDIKLASMTAEVSEVYQILEFFHIIDDYPSINDALKSFGKNSEPDKVTGELAETESDDDEPINQLLELSGVEPHSGEKPKNSNMVMIQEPTLNKSETVREENKKQPEESLGIAMKHVGKAVLAGAITTSGVFIVIALSRMRIMRNFGLVTAAVIFYALVAALLILAPLLVSYAKREEKKRLINSKTQKIALES